MLTFQAPGDTSGLIDKPTHDIPDRIELGEFNQDYLQVMDILDEADPKNQSESNKSKRRSSP